MLYNGVEVSVHYRNKYGVDCQVSFSLYFSIEEKSYQDNFYNTLKSFVKKENETRNLYVTLNLITLNYSIKDFKRYVLEYDNSIKIGEYDIRERSFMFDEEVKQESEKLARNTILKMVKDEINKLRK